MTYVGRPPDSSAAPRTLATMAAADSPVWLKSAKDAVDILQSVATIGALLVAAWWVLRRRKTYPRARFNHAVSDVALNADIVLLRVSVAIENVGDVLLRLDKSVAGVQQISPIATEIEPWLSARDELIGSAVTEFDWPFLDSRQRNWSGNEVEPGEAAAFDFELFIPRGIRHVLVYSYFRNVTKPEDVGWNTSTIYEIRNSGN